jgi:hypothetical protein
MACQICLRQLEGSEPVYRMRFGAAIYGGSRTSICERCVYAFESAKYLSLGHGFRSKEPCEVCGRPVYHLKQSKVMQVICSPGCRGVIDVQSAKRMPASRQRRDAGNPLRPGPETSYLQAGELGGKMTKDDADCWPCRRLD